MHLGEALRAPLEALEAAQKDLAVREAKLREVAAARLKHNEELSAAAPSVAALPRKIEPLADDTGLTTARVSPTGVASMPGQAA